MFVSSLASACNLLQVSPTTSHLILSIGWTLKSFSKECELNTRAELRILPFLPPFLPHQAVKSSKVRPLPCFLLFFSFFSFPFKNSPAGLDEVREGVFPALGIGHRCVP